ncbi:MAG: stage III sporulation protein AE [Oscillospiraceae bacterium]|nr:stage III sporulation protein AE [Oscillospiraceae bacterium]
MNELESLESRVNHDLFAALPPDAAELVSNIEPLEITFGAVMSEIWQIFVGEITAPFQMLIALVGVIVLCAAANALRDSASGAEKNTAAVGAFDMVAVLAGAGVISMAVAGVVMRVIETLTAAGAFMLTFIPILAGIMAIMGQLVSANLFNASVILAAQVFSQVMITALMPLSASVLGVSIAGAVNPDLKTEKLAETVKTAVIWILGISATVFSGLLGLQSLVSGNADSVTMKAVRFTVSGSVPFIGGAMGDALGVVNASVGVLKSTTGAFGIIAIVAVCLPAILSVVGFRLSMSLASAVSGFFGTERIGVILKSGENVMSVILAMLACFTLIMLVSIAMMIRISGA